MCCLNFAISLPNCTWMINPLARISDGFVGAVLLKKETQQLQLRLPIFATISLPAIP